ncbi:MAG: cyclopropane-fatty-acyl-phospholipid synthase family protein [Pseudomonadota bacterium]
MLSSAPRLIPPIAVTAQNKSHTLKGLPPFFRAVCEIALRLEVGALAIVLPDGRALAFEGRERADVAGVLRVVDYAFARRVVFGGDVGFFESYADGQWDSPDLSALLTVLALNADRISKAFEGAPFAGWIQSVRHALNRNTRAGARRNIMAHYDLGNTFYEKWLDRTMTYSSARNVENAADLEGAQTEKYRALAASIDLHPSDTVLEIGSGWGGFAEFAAKDVGATVTGLTISKAQYDYARERVFREGLAERVTFRLEDYRDHQGGYDKVASIEMFEAVGAAYWPAYFSKVRECLKPGGVAGFQIITIADRFFDHYRKNPDFIQRYVFPGGMLPSLGKLRGQIDDAGLAWRDMQAFGRDYALTLSAWRDRFTDAWDDIAAMGFNEHFQKLWRYYLSYCEAGFRAQTTDVVQLSVRR